MSVERSPNTPLSTKSEVETTFVVIGDLFCNKFRHKFAVEILDHDKFKKIFTRLAFSIWMQFGSVIFVVTAVLLVPFVYAASFIPDSCAEVSSPGYQSSKDCTGDKSDSKGKTCCWRANEGGSLGVEYCQTCKITCDSKQCSETCGHPEKQLVKPPTADESGPMQDGGVLEDPTTDPKSSQDVLPGGGILEQPENNMTFSKSNVPFPQANDSDDK